MDFLSFFYVILELTAYPLSYRLLDLLIDGILEFFISLKLSIFVAFL